MQDNQHAHHIDRVRSYWNQASCGTEFIQEEKFSVDYFAAIEAFRYAIESDIFSFAQFTRYHKKKVLEVGVGAGTDFIQWVRAGAYAYGIDLTQEAINNTRKRLALEHLSASYLDVADAQKLPFAANFFDLIYSWGVIHHAPSMTDCLQEMVRVTKPNGTMKIMVYTRNSLFAFYQYLIHGVKKGKPFSRWKDIIYNHQESFGTQAFSQQEMRCLLAYYPVTIMNIQSPITAHDLLYYKSLPYQYGASLLAVLAGWQKAGWYMMIELKKNAS